MQKSHRYPKLLPVTLGVPRDPLTCHWEHRNLCFCYCLPIKVLATTLLQVLSLQMPLTDGHVASSQGLVRSASSLHASDSKPALRAGQRWDRNNGSHPFFPIILIFHVLLPGPSTKPPFSFSVSPPHTNTPTNPNP